MSPFLKQIARRTGRDQVLSWILIVVAKFTHTARGVEVCVEIQRLVEGRPEAFDEFVPEFHGLQHRMILLSSEPYCYKGCIHHLSFDYWEDDKSCRPLTSIQAATKRLFQRRYMDYIWKHGKPIYLGWSLVTLAAVVGAQNVHLHDEDQGWFACHSLMAAPSQVEDRIRQVRRGQRATR